MGKIQVFKLSLIGLLVFSFVSLEANTNENGTVSKAKTENRHVKRNTPSSSRITVAIAQFENRCNAPDEILGEIRTRVQLCVAGTMKFEVLDRERIGETLSAQTLAAAGVTNSEEPDVPMAGKIKPASYIVHGKVLSCDVDKQVVGVGGIACTFAKSKIELGVRIVNCNSGRIVAVKTVVGHGQKGASNGCKPSTGEAMRDAIDEVSHAVADWLRVVFACPAKVLDVEKAEIIIDMNENEVKEDDVFDVIKVVTVVDPDSGEKLEFGGKCIGRVVITCTGLRASMAKPVEGCSLPLEKLDIPKKTYKLRRVTKSALRNEEAKRRARKASLSLEERFGK